MTGIFYGEINIQNVHIKFYTVLDSTMVYKGLLGRDFLTYLFLCATLGKTVEIAIVHEENSLMNTEYDKDPLNDWEIINAVVDREVVDRICEIYTISRD